MFILSAGHSIWGKIDAPTRTLATTPQDHQLQGKFPCFIFWVQI
jgi:hypothetical protein